MVNPHITVLMSCYNSEKWLSPAIESVLSQSFRDFELILINDGSTDQTHEVLTAYQRKDSRTVVINKRNTGLADSLNAGIEIARGAWIARLDADDLCDPKRLEKQLSYVESHPRTILLGSGCWEISGSGNLIKPHRYPEGHDRLLRRLTRLGGFFPHSSAFFRRDVVEQLGGYRCRIKRAEDMDLWLRLSEHGDLSCLPDLLVRVRQHDAQISREEDGRRHQIDAFASIACHFLRRSGQADPIEADSNEDALHFLAWIEERLEDARVFERKRMWVEARKEYLSSSAGFFSTLSPACRLIVSPHLISLISRKVFGCKLPERLASEWPLKFEETTLKC